MFGATNPPQDENSLFHPRSPYGVAKLFSHWATRNYREAYGLFASCGIMFNHESPRRGETFVTRKITRAVARIARGEQNELFLGNLDARRDWGYAPEYVVAMWKMLQQDSPDDYVVSTGSDLSVREFVELSFAHVGLDWQKYVRFDERYLRPSEVETLVGNSEKAEAAFGWKPSVSATQLAAIMVDHDVKILDGYSSDVPAGAMWEAAVSPLR
jgi:GDPmannose 4,6-dehydratase